MSEEEVQVFGEPVEVMPFYSKASAIIVFLDGVPDKIGGFLY